MKKFFLVSVLLTTSIINTKAPTNPLESFNLLKEQDQKELLKAARSALKCILHNDPVCEEFQNFSNEVLIKKIQATTLQKSDLEEKEICEELKDDINNTCKNISVKTIHQKYNHYWSLFYKNPDYNTLVDNNMSDDELKVFFNLELRDYEKGAYFYALIMQKIEDQKFCSKEDLEEIVERNNEKIKEACEKVSEEIKNRNQEESEKKDIREKEEIEIKIEMIEKV